MVSFVSFDGGMFLAANAMCVTHFIFTIYLVPDISLWGFVRVPVSYSSTRWTFVLYWIEVPEVLCDLSSDSGCIDVASGQKEVLC